MCNSAIPRTVAWQAPLFIDFCRQEYWSELPCPPPGYLPNPGIELVSLTHPALAGGFFTTSATWEAPKVVVLMLSHVQLFVTPLDCSSAGSSIQGIFQARILEWVAYSRGSSWPKDWTHVSCCFCIGRRFFTTEPPGKPSTKPQRSRKQNPLILALEAIGVFDLQSGGYPRVHRAIYKTEKEKQQNVYF